jgi:hypothetical protein
MNSRTVLLLPCWSVLAVLLCLSPQCTAQTLINLNFGDGSKVGFAAAGISTNDFWNRYHPTNEVGGIFANGFISPVGDSTGGGSGAGLLVYGVQGHATAGFGDAMFNTYLWASNATITLQLTNLQYGYYEVWIYGHGNANLLNGAYQVATPFSNHVQQATTTNASWTNTLWQEGSHYVRYLDVLLAPGHILTVSALPGASGFALINGLQVYRVPNDSSDDDADGLTNAHELLLGTNPNSTDTDGDGVSDYVEVMRGRNPLVAGVIIDTANTTLKLDVHTPLK